MLFLASLLAEDISKFKGCKIVNSLENLVQHDLQLKLPTPTGSHQCERPSTTNDVHCPTMNTTQ